MINFILKKVPRGLNSLKRKINKIAFGKFETIPIDLGKIKDMVKNNVVKKTVYDELVQKANPIDTSGLIRKADYNANCWRWNTWYY